jgi:asparagine synthase (glutamine-hydrolysing)
MCGIVGSFLKVTPENFETKLDLALDVLHHRGPDNKSFEVFKQSTGTLILGHTRLSIIELSSNSNQPMKSFDGRYIIVFNGEIYNYRELREQLINVGYNFKTDSDTEVLMAVWANWNVEGLRLLVGMFAFVIYNTVELTITLVRDAFGIKPLLYYNNSNGLLFSSDINALKVLVSENIEINVSKSLVYLITGEHDYDNESFIENIFQLLPAHYLQVNLRTGVLSKPTKWWCPSIKERTDLSFEDASMVLRNLFLKSVRLHLRSDVPLGAALSGGIDSSSIVCAIRYLEPNLPIHTFSYVARGSEFDEEKWIDIVNESVSAISHKIYVNDENLFEDLEDLVYTQGEPFGTTSIYAQYKVFQLAKECGITVVLDGQGADESLAGYEGYPIQVLREYVNKLQGRKIVRFANSYKKRTGKSRLGLFKKLLISFVPFKYKYIFKNLFVRFKIKIPTWINSQFFSLKSSININDNTIDISNRILANELRNSLGQKGIGKLLRYEDRNSMRWSIESRVPFLNIELVEFLLTLPSSYLISEFGETKRIFRAAMRGIVPDEILDRRDKIGFNTPEAKWMLKLCRQLKSKLDTINIHAMLKHDLVLKELDNVSNHRKFSYSQIWRLINFYLWFDNQKTIENK